MYTDVYLDINDESLFVWREWPEMKNYLTNEDGLVACKVYKSMPAHTVWDIIMTSTYDYAEPGFVLIDKVNEMNNNRVWGPAPQKYNELNGNQRRGATAIE